ncbi:MAG: sigma-70 family RNA polymerase sigma factor [Dehalococcoidia bacterium]|nr:sigma-70 family RNA polymerase sigma factor [Dehalococcoidia bacterium]NUQ55973.1 sigma-70 family RNA polymerase sigma factor [Dehalococcoidia bacterium]
MVRDTEVQSDGPDEPRINNAEEVARRAAAGDPEAWSAIFEAHYRGIYAFVRYRLRGVTESEDIASQVFEIAYSRASKFDYRGVPIEAWLIGIARNLVRDHVKKVSRRGYEEELQETTEFSESDSAHGVDLKQDIAAAMRGLTEDQQTVLSLRFLMDKSVAETASLMERSEDAVKNLQRRALAAMQRALVGTGYGEGLSR